jgi:3-oxoacyl-[acyl-carrier protein] reductase
MDLELTDRVVVVTGGTSGLGSAVARALVAEGARVVVASRSEDRVAAAADALGGPERAVGVVADIVSRSTPDQLLQAATDAFGRVDGLFVSHGGPMPGPPLEVDDDTLDESLALAAAGPIRLLRSFGAALGDGGAMVALTSTSSVEPINGLATSNLTRPAVWGYVKSLADELGPRGVRVNVLMPGRFATERFTQVYRAVADDQGRSFESVIDDVAAAIPLRRIGDPAELGRVATFLLSPAASYVTGQAWAADGGAIRAL